MRKSSDMEPACRKLDKAAGAKKKEEKDIKKAYDDYDKDRKKYQSMLNDSAANQNQPYHLVPHQIEALGKAMVDIGEDFKDKHFIGHKQKKRNQLFTKHANDLSPFCDEMDAYLNHLGGRDEKLRDKKQQLGDHYKTVAAEAEKIINQRLKPGLLALKTLASDQHIPNRIDAIIKTCKTKTDEDPFNSSDTVLYVKTWFSDIKKDIEIEIAEWKKLP